MEALASQPEGPVSRPECLLCCVSGCAGFGATNREIRENALEIRLWRRRPGLGLDVGCPRAGGSCGSPPSLARPP